jgi:hypothetical protein
MVRGLKYPITRYSYVLLMHYVARKASRVWQDPAISELHELIICLKSS